MSQNERRRQARLQGRHGVPHSKQRPACEKELSSKQSRYQNELQENVAVSPPIVYPVDTSCYTKKSQETDAICTVGERMIDGSKNRGRKHPQRDFNSRQRGGYPPRRGGWKGSSNYESNHVSLDGNVDEALQSLNGQNVNIDPISVDQNSYPARYYPAKNGKSRPHPKQRSACDKELSSKQSRYYQNELQENGAVSPPVVYPADSCNTENSQESDAICTVAERMIDGSRNRGRKHSQRDFNSRQRGGYPPRRGSWKGASNYEIHHVSSDGNVDETLQLLNGQSVNIDDTINGNHIADQNSYPTQSYKSRPHPKQRLACEKELSSKESRYQNKLQENGAVSPPVFYPADTSCNTEKSQETDATCMVAAISAERMIDGSKNRGRKHLQSGFNSRQRGGYPPRRGSWKGANNYESHHVSSDGNVDETLQSLNGLSVNIDATISDKHIADQNSYPTQPYPAKNGKSRPWRANNRNNRFYGNTNEQKYNSKFQSEHNLDRGRSSNRFVRNRPRIDRTHYSADEIAIKEASISGSYDNECRIEIQHSVSVDNYKLPQESSDIVDGCHQRLSFGKKSIFVYEETNQAETVIQQKTKGPITLNVIGWHKMFQRSSEDKESFLYFKPDFLGEEERESYYLHLRESISWKEKEIIIRGEKYMQPRLVAWYGPLPYSYSNSVLESNCEFPPIIFDLKERIEKILREEQRNVTFNSVLLNLYRNGKDSVAWHSDDELSMGIEPTIASVSLGETRRFEMKLKQDRKGDQQESDEYVIHLTSGSLLVMDGAMQQYWLHRVPKEFHDRNCRINLTFRTVYPMKEK